MKGINSKIHLLRPAKTKNSIRRTYCGSPYKWNSRFNVQEDLSLFLKNENDNNCAMCLSTINSQNK